MRWDDLFTALEHEYEALGRQSRDADIAERTRSAQAQASWLMRCRNADLRLKVRGAGMVCGHVVRATPPWLLVRGAGSVDVVVATAAVTSVTGLADTATALDAVHQRMGWTHAWRVLSRDRSEVRVTCVDASTVGGVAQTVGRDYVSLRSYDSGRPARTPPVAVPYEAIATVTCPR